MESALVFAFEVFGAKSQEVGVICVNVPQVQLNRAKENVEKVSSERDSCAASEHREKEAVKRIQRQLREAKDEQGDLLKREQEALQKKHDLVRTVPGKLFRHHSNLKFFEGYILIAS